MGNKAKHEEMAQRGQGDKGQAGDGRLSTEEGTWDSDRDIRVAGDTAQLPGIAGTAGDRERPRAHPWD